MGDGDDELLGALYASVTRDDAFATVLALLARRFRCPSAALLFVDPLRPEADVALGHGLLDEAAQARYRAEYAALDPAPAAMARLPLGSAGATDRLIDPEERKSGRFFNEFYKPLGLRESLGGPITDGEAGRFGILAVHRGPDRPAFDDGEIAAFERLVPHVARAVELRRAFFAIETRAAALEAAVEPGPAGLLVFPPAGVLTHANRAARLILDRSDGLVLDRAGRLRAVDGATDRRFSAAFAPNADLRAPVVLRVPRRGGESFYAVRLSRAANGSAPWRAAHPAAVLATVHDPEAAFPDGRDLLAEVFGLNPPSARLVAALAAGEDLGAYARRTGLSLNTVKFHLKAAFAATGTRRQADLVRRAAAMVQDLGAPAAR